MPNRPPIASGGSMDVKASGVDLSMAISPAQESANCLLAHNHELTKQGFTVVESVADDETLDALVQQLFKLERDLGLGPSDNDFEGRQTVRAYNLLAHGEVFHFLPVHEEILPIVDAALGQDCLLSTIGSIAIGPGEVEQPIHSDDQVIPMPRPHAPLIINAMWALTDFTAGNGATRVVPGSHLASEPPEYGREYETLPVEMGRGSVMIWNGSLWHAGGANCTDDRRIGVSVNYCAGYLRQEENQQLGVPPEIVRSLPKRLQSLIGYDVYHGVIGHIEKATPATRILGNVAVESMRWESPEHDAFLSRVRSEL